MITWFKRVSHVPHLRAVSLVTAGSLVLLLQLHWNRADWNAPLPSYHVALLPRRLATGWIATKSELVELGQVRNSLVLILSTRQMSSETFLSSLSGSVKSEMLCVILILLL